MSILRIFGLALALTAFSVVVFRLRRHSESRFDVAILSIFGGSMLLVSLFPSLVNLPAELLSLDRHERGRLLTVLLLSTIALWLLLIYERGKTRLLSLSFDRLVRSLAVQKFFESPPHAQADTIMVLVPAYNEEVNLCSVIPNLPKQVLGRELLPLIVDDGSIDATQNVCAQFNVPTARNPINRGGGAALRVGFDIALQLGVGVIVTMDGDGQHRPEDISTLVEPIITGEADLVIGSRLLGQMENYSKLRYWGVVLFGRLISVLIGVSITDPASGFRAFTPKVVESCVLTQDQYHTAELIIEGAKRNLNITERPVTIQRRLSGTSKKGKDLKYAGYFLRTILRTWLR